MGTGCALTAVLRSTLQSGVAKSSIGFGWGNGGKVTSAGWQVTLCDPTWHVNSRSGEAGLHYPCELRSLYLPFTNITITECNSIAKLRFLRSVSQTLNIELNN